MAQSFEVFDFYYRISPEQIMLSSKSDITPGLLNSILRMVVQNLESFEETSRIKKKVFIVIVEVMQNLIHHNGDFAGNGQAASMDTAVIAMIDKNAAGYSILTGNYVSNQNLEKLNLRLEDINAMSTEDLKNLYKSVLVNGEHSPKGGGGLGMIDIARNREINSIMALCRLMTKTHFLA